VFNRQAISRRQFTFGATALLAALVASQSSIIYARPTERLASQGDAPLQDFDNLVQWLTTRCEELRVPGAAIGVAVGDQRFTHALGVTQIGTEDAFSTSTQFGIASLTKIFTATALASLVQDGALGLEYPVAGFLPEFRLSSPDATAALNVGHLLSHAGGWADILEPVPGQDSLAWYAGQMADLPQVAPVGTQFSYGNSGFMLAGAVIEQVAGATYEDVISEAVLQPLGMKNSGFAGSTGANASRATGHQLDDGQLAPIPVEDAPRAVNPAAGLLSNVDDMLTFVQAHATIDPGQLNPDALASMRHPRNSGGSVGPVVVDHIGTGWMLLDFDGETVLMSQGGDAGLISAMIAVPSRQFGMVVLANSDTAMMLVNDAVFRGLSTFTGLSLPEPKTHTLSGDEAANADGQFGLPEWMTFTVTAADGSLNLVASAGGQEISDLSGEFTMTSATRGFKPYLGGRLWVDLVADGTGKIQWLRFAARLLPRIE
jgi:CubicO group peptidase (beta-lactamase class C family)